MLDECKGERFEELLAAFSSAVLKKTVADKVADGEEHLSPAIALVLENFGYQGDPANLRPLILAHRASLSGKKKKKEAAGAAYHDFDELLAIKQRGLARRREAVEAQKAGSDGPTPGMLRVVRNNWLGNEAWMDTLLYGDGSAKGNQGLFSSPFDRVWRRVQQGSLADLEEDSRGLLEQLDGRVKVQQDRLAKWDAIRKDMAYKRTPQTPLKKKATTTEKRGIDLRFEAHKGLQTGSMSRNLASEKQAGLDEDYQRIIQELHDELGDIKTSNAHDVLSPLLKRKKRDSYLHAPREEYVEEEPISEISELEESPPQLQPDTTRFESNMKTTKRLPRPLAFQGRREPSYERPVPGESPAYETEATSATESMASLNIEDGQRKSSSSTPSPTKSSRQRLTLSLAERTRMSMLGSRFLEDEPELPLGPSGGNKPAAASPPKEEDDTVGDIEYEDLASRTRKSMAGFEKAQQRAQQERRRSVRRSKVLPRREGSLFPPVQEEVQDQDALIERLMADDNMEAIFQSRPKIRASPIPPEWDDY